MTEPGKTGHMSLDIQGMTPLSTSGQQSCCRDCSVEDSRALISTLSLWRNSHQHCNRYLEKMKMVDEDRCQFTISSIKHLFFPTVTKSDSALIWTGHSCSGIGDYLTKRKSNRQGQPKWAQNLNISEQRSIEFQACRPKEYDTSCEL